MIVWLLILKALVWIRNICIPMSLYWGYMVISKWSAAGKNYDLVESGQLLWPMALFIIPMMIVTFVKLSLKSKGQRLKEEGKHYLDTEEYDKAISFFNEFLVVLGNTENFLLPDEMDVYLYRGTAYQKSGRFKEAKIDYERVTSVTSSDPSWNQLISKAKEAVMSLPPGEDTTTG